MSGFDSRVGCTGVEFQRPLSLPTCRSHLGVVEPFDVLVLRLVLAAPRLLFLSMPSFCWWEKPGVWALVRALEVQRAGGADFLSACP